jgi:sugar O-acyltransferase (sialic acid O-acetyltransferase NeuD family)
MAKTLIIVGASVLAEIAYEYFTYDSQYQVECFAVERKFREKDSLFGLPIVDLEYIIENYKASKYLFHVAIGYNKLNYVRANMISYMIRNGFEPFNYINSTVKILSSTSIGQHCFIFGNNIIEPFVSIGDNCILWSSSTICHHTKIGNNCFIAPGVVLAGFSKIGDNSFVGANSSVVNFTEIGRDCFIGAGSVIAHNLPENSIVKPASNKIISGAREMMRCGS